MLRRSLVLLLFVAGIFTHPALATEWRVALGSHDQVVTKNKQVIGGLGGFNEALAREICRRANVHCTFVTVDFKTIFEGVASGEYQLGFGNFLRTPEREQRVAFSAPIWSSSSRLVGTVESSRRFANEGVEVQLEKLNGARIITIVGTAQHRYLQANAAARRLILVEVRDLQDVPARMLAGEADFLLLPALTGYSLISSLPGGKLQFIGPAVAEHGLGGPVHIALPKSDAAVQKAVDQAIAAIRADGSYQRIVRRLFPLSLD